MMPHDNNNLRQNEGSTVNPISAPKRFITLPLLRKRSEHNEGLVSTLEELALHQEELQSIGPVVGRTCGKTLKILLLQNNVIERMVPSELKLFRCLEYLNLALNNIHRIEGVSGMEWLRKLDLTLNFIPLVNLEHSVDELTGCRSLEELFLIGNPCMGTYDETGSGKTEGGKGNFPLGNVDVQSAPDSKGWSGCRPYIIAKLPSLRYLDGTEVKRYERIAALQKLPSLIEELRSLTRNHNDHRVAQSFHTNQDCLVGANDVIDDDSLTHHNPETRNKISNELYVQKQAKQKQETSHLVPERGEKEWQDEHKDAIQKVRERENRGFCNGVISNNITDGGDKLKPNGEIRQCNQGKWQYWFQDDEPCSGHKHEANGGTLIMRVAVPKHLSTSLIDVDIHPNYVSVFIKSKVLRVLLPSEVVSDQSVARRVVSSGHLELTLTKSNPKEVLIGTARVISKDHGVNEDSVYFVNGYGAKPSEGESTEPIGDVTS